MSDWNQASAYIAALTGSIDALIDMRALHDTNKALPARMRRGTLAQCWPDMVQANSEGYGVFVMISETNGLGRELQNITSHRSHFLELDQDAAANLERVSKWYYAPHLIVESSAGKYHGYLFTKPYGPDADRFRALQHKLVVEYGSDPQAVDAARVLRVPGFYNHKYPDRAPHMVHCWTGPAWGRDRYEIGALEIALSHVKAPMGGNGGRKPLGDPSLAAPSRDWIKAALERIDPNVDRAEWIKYTAAIKQSGIGCGMSEADVRALWEEWCQRYVGNDPGENAKQWNSISNSAAGWPMLLNASGLKAASMFGNGPAAPAMPSPAMGGSAPAAHGGAGDAPQPDLGTFLDEREQAQHFAGCTYIVSLGRVLTPKGLFLDQSQFNAVYGGKAFKIKDDGTGMSTDEAWKAATRGQRFRIPQVEFTRFLPAKPTDQPFIDEFGLKAINTYRPAKIAMRPGDPAPFVRHIRAILPTERDAEIYLAYLAHCVQRPGVKAKWAPLIQSTEGAGKGLIAQVMTHAVGRAYTHSVNARELGEGGGKFNGWMEGKLLIIADEIRVDDRRDMIEVLKPMITDETIEIQRKGVDQVIGDNVSNWLMFSNYKDAIPITNNSRRFAIFYSPIQTKGDLIRAGMNATYFSALFGWLQSGGYEIVAHYLKHYAIPAEFDPSPTGQALTAPETSSHAEALIESRGQYEQKIADAVAEGKPGFMGGWVSSWAVNKLLGGRVGPRIISKTIEGLGYSMIGRVTHPVSFEENSKPTVYCLSPNANIAEYDAAQGYPVHGAPIPLPNAR